ncbi:MAG: copper amine oxidase N-terminal domain-containing protein, partial [Cellulosilyticum sp.]|nr:copper amine oxidase N-terminal domain-containing protein [Cellulosilyticum sp.]
MKMSKNYKKLCLALGLCGILGAGAVTAEMGTRSVQATYRNIQVSYNGVNQPMSVEPFLVNNSTYVPLRAIGDILGVSARYDSPTNTVVLTGGSATSQEELTNLRYQVAALQQELAQANAELAQYKANSSTSNSTNNTTNGSNITTEQLKKTEEYLNSSFSDYFNNITMNYSLSSTSSQINVVISYETRSENTTFGKLTQSKIEAFMKKIGDNIAATHSDIAISGTIEYTKDSEEKAAFTRSKTGKYSYTHAFDEDTVKDAIEDAAGSSFYFNGIRCSSLSISNKDVNIREAKSTVNVKLYLSADNSFRNIWGKKVENNSTTEVISDSERKRAVTSQLEDLQEAIMDVTNGYEVKISVYYDSSELIAEINADGKINA